MPVLNRLSDESDNAMLPERDRLCEHGDQWATG